VFTFKLGPACANGQAVGRGEMVLSAFSGLQGLSE
jgi:hypothetical protein